MKAEPVMLMNNVPHGNNPGARRPNHSATQYLNTPPVAAPNATAREFHVAVTAWISSLLIMPKPLIALWFAAALVSSAQTVAQLYAEKTLANIAAVDRTLDGVLTVAAIDLTTGETLE